MSLRRRLLIGVVAVVALGLIAAGSTTYLSIRAFLLQRADQTLTSSAGPISRVLLQAVTNGPGQFAGGDVQNGPDRRVPFPLGTVAQLRDASGRAMTGSTITFTFGAGTDISKIPKPILPTTVVIGHSSTFRTVDSNTGTMFRVIVKPFADGSGAILIAMPLSDVETTLNRLLLVELLFGLLALAVATGLAWWSIRVGLRPLDRIEATANAIAEGDLARRIEGANPATEVGRLSLALNHMLERLEMAFAARAESEARLRRFAADASHELRTPLASIRGYAELFRRGAATKPEDLATSMSRIEAEATRMGVLVDDLLLLARLDARRPMAVDPVDLVTLVEDAAADARAAAPDRAITLTNDQEVIIRGDEVHLRQVVANLVRNAIVHTPPATPIELSARLQGDVGLLRVVDHGAGIDPANHAAIFARFHRVDEARSRDQGGTGLGLAIVSGVVGAHDGTVDITDTVGGGATFEVRFPLWASTEESEN
jgi:two-component system OmpR family sensor kinase